MYIGIDIGGTRTRIVGSQSLDNIMPTGKSVILTNKVFEKGIFEISKSIKRLTTNPKAIGIGIAGRISEDGRKFTHSTNLSTWTNKSMVKILEDEFSCFVYMKNDAVAQSLGEAYYGVKPDTNFLYLVWGTGVGGALISQSGKKIKSTKLGRPYLDKWERKFGGKNIEERFGKTAKQLNETEWNVVLSEFTNSIQDLSNKLHVDTVVISGGIVDKQKDRISKILNNISSPKILFSKLGEDIGVYGGIAIIKASQDN